MTRRARVGLSPSLFPFLAVLVCTLGTLILLLALVAQNATTSAKQQAEAKQAAEKLATDADNNEPPPTREVVDRMIHEGEFRVTQLISFRDAQTADLEERRDRITHLDDHIRRIREELAHLNREVELATSDSPLITADEHRIEELKTKLESEQKHLEELRQSARSKKPRVVIVPHKGPNGTDRRPVYLECTAAGLTIWPEGSRIEINELLAAQSHSNPLDSALRTVRLYVMQHYGDSTPPYPLLVVRPDGIETYGAARRAMHDWDDQFGYELVPADVDLAYSKPDALLKLKVEDAIREAVAHQSPSLSFQGMTFARSGGSAISGSRVRTLSAAELDRQARSGGYSDTRASSRTQNSYSSTTNYGSSTNYGSPATTDGVAASQLDSRLEDAAQELAGSGGDGPSLNMPSLANASGSGDSLAANGSKSTSTTGDSTADGASTYFNLPNTDELTGTRIAATDPLASASSATDSMSSESMPSGTGTASSSAANSATGDPSSTDPSSTDPSSTDSSTGTTEQTAANPSTTNQTASNQTSGDAGSHMQGSSTPTQSSTLAGGGQASASGSPEQASGAPSVSVSNSPPPTSTRKALQRIGKDWALPSNVAGHHGTAVVRTIRAVCSSDQLVLLPPASGGATEVFGFSDGRIDRATLELAAAVRDRIEQWGPSLPGGRWQPRLEVQVPRDGTTRFEQLQSLMNGSGVDVIGKPSP